MMIQKVGFLDEELHGWSPSEVDANESSQPVALSTRTYRVALRCAKVNKQRHSQAVSSVWSRWCRLNGTITSM
jgi:hypothetical protein